MKMPAMIKVLLSLAALGGCTTPPQPVEAVAPDPFAGINPAFGGIPHPAVQYALVSTVRELDIAIQGEGFFQIEYMNGQVLLTRNGCFQRDSEGNIVTCSGFRLLPRITLAPNVVRVQVTRDGHLLAYDWDGNELYDFQIQLDRVTSPRMLVRIEGDLYMAVPELSGSIVTGEPCKDGFGMLLYGHLEAAF